MSIFENYDNIQEQTFDECVEENISVVENTVLLCEGATWDSMKVATSSTAKAAKKHLQAGKVYLRQGDSKKAKEEFQQSKSNYEKLIKMLKSIDDDGIGNFCGFMVSGGLIQLFINVKGAGGTGGKEYLKTWVMTALGSVVGAPLIGPVVKLITNYDKLDPKEASYNLIKSDLLVAMNKNLEVINKLIKAC